MPDRLDPYRGKRDPGRTPEPFGPARPADAGPLAPRPFVVQKHAARRLHWDFRLELDGTLRSWAVPKGPSYDPADKRMAVEVEDHPVEYADFEGVIPPGNYGAGAVIVWDRGTWRPLSDPRAGLERGKLVFELAGYKLRGEWTLVRTRRVEGGKQQWLLLKHRDALAGPGRVLPEESVLTGRLVDDVARGDHRADEALAEARRLGAPALRRRSPGGGPMRAEAGGAPPGGRGWLFEPSYDGYRAFARREGGRATLRYAGGGDATALFPEVTKAIELLPADATLDGVVVVLSPDGRPSLDSLRERARLRGRAEVARAAVERPATLFAFDLLALGPLDLRPLPLRERKRLLATIVPRLGPVRYSEHVEERGEDLLREVTERGLDGVVAKRADAPYRAGRSPAWRTIRAGRPGGAARGREPPPPAAAPEAPERRVDVTGADQVPFPEDGITKGEVVAYYRAIAPLLLPWLADRPLAFTRFPDGIHGKAVFQEDAPAWRPGWLRTVSVRHEAGRDVEHLLVDDADGLAWIANLGAVPVHVHAGRAGAVDRPDWCVLDLEAEGATFADAVGLARALHDLCRAVGLPAYPKTSGEWALQLLVPLGRQLTHAQARTLGELLARSLEQAHPDAGTTARAGSAAAASASASGATARARTIVAPYAVLPRPGAPVSAPLRWSEVRAGLDPARFTLRTMPARARRLRRDPALPVLSGAPDLAAALDRLRALLGSRGAPAPRRR